MFPICVGYHAAVACYVGVGLRTGARSERSDWRKGAHHTRRPTSYDGLAQLEKVDWIGSIHGAPNVAPMTQPSLLKPSFVVFTFCHLHVDEM